jgi:transposase-like protein
VSTVIRYSEAFKRQVVDEIAQGKFTSYYEAQCAYGISGNTTVKHWLKKYGRMDLLGKKVRIETVEEKDQLKEARERIRKLEAALADAHIDHLLEHAFLEIACERMDESIDDFKKKNASSLSDARKKRGLN